MTKKENKMEPEETHFISIITNFDFQWQTTVVYIQARTSDLDNENIYEAIFERAKESKNEC